MLRRYACNGWRGDILQTMVEQQVEITRYEIAGAAMATGGSITKKAIPVGPGRSCDTLRRMSDRIGTEHELTTKAAYIYAHKEEYGRQTSSNVIAIAETVSLNTEKRLEAESERSITLAKPSPMPLNAFSEGAMLRRATEVISRAEGRRLDIVYQTQQPEEGREEAIFTVTGYITQAVLPPIRESMR
ncbi:hypothetical protein PHLGIDRAFT_17047, partial [Phlebiopsis gigantea 11061_1 CR5-6]